MAAAQTLTHVNCHLRVTLPAHMEPRCPKPGTPWPWLSSRKAEGRSLRGGLLSAGRRPPSLAPVVPFASGGGPSLALPPTPSPFPEPREDVAGTQWEASAVPWWWPGRTSLLYNPRGRKASPVLVPVGPAAPAPGGPAEHSLVHSEADQAPAEAGRPLLLQGLAPQEGDGGLELAGEGQARLQGAVVLSQVRVPVPVACAEGTTAQHPRARHPPASQSHTVGWDRERLTRALAALRTLGTASNLSLVPPPHPSSRPRGCQKTRPGGVPGSRVAGVSWGGGARPGSSSFPGPVGLCPLPPPYPPNLCAPFSMLRESMAR